jgi:predicted dehydrogenase
MAKNVGILGFAHGHVGAYCFHWCKQPEMGIRVLTGWDHDAGRLQETVVLARDDVDAVAIGSETSRHAELVEAAAAAGKPIILQKPAALALAEADRIVDAVNRHGVPFTMAWQMRTDPQNIKIKELVDDGTIGKLTMVRRRHGLGCHTWPSFFDSWHVDPKQNRDIWADDSSHPIDFIHWLLGLPETVTAELVTVLDKRMPNDNGIAIYRYADGPLAEVCCSFTCLAAENTVEIFGEKGVIIQNFGDGPSCNLPHAGESGLKWMVSGDADWTYGDIPSPEGHGERIAGVAGPLAEFIYGRRPPIATAEEGRDSLRMVLATYVSTREGQRVSITDERIADV